MFSRPKVIWLVLFLLQMVPVTCTSTQSSYIQMPLHTNGHLVVCQLSACLILIFCLDRNTYILFISSFLPWICNTSSTCCLMFAAVAELLDNAIDEVSFFLPLFFSFFLAAQQWNFTLSMMILKFLVVLETCLIYLKKDKYNTTHNCVSGTGNSLLPELIPNLIINYPNSSC